MGQKGRQLGGSVYIPERPKVVHEWGVDGARMRVVIDGRVCLEELDPQFGWCRNDYIDDDLADELARLAARVKELEILLSAAQSEASLVKPLEAENKRLREQVRELVAENKQLLDTLRLVTTY